MWLTHVLVFFRAWWWVSRPSVSVCKDFWSIFVINFSLPNHLTETSLPSTSVILPGQAGQLLAGPHTKSPTTNLWSLFVSSISKHQKYSKNIFLFPWQTAFWFAKSCILDDERDLYNGNWKWNDRCKLLQNKIVNSIYKIITHTNLLIMSWVSHTM